MKCRKQLVLTGYRVQFVDLREQMVSDAAEELFATISGREDYSE